jgi:hypothetical protein
LERPKGALAPQQAEYRNISASGARHDHYHAFEPHRRAILLCAGNKEGGNSRKFCAELIAAADDRFGKYK